MGGAQIHHRHVRDVGLADDDYVRILGRALQQLVHELGIQPLLVERPFVESRLELGLRTLLLRPLVGLELPVGPELGLSRMGLPRLVVSGLGPGLATSSRSWRI